ncbi:hypothetical protein GBA52_008318 [Prunus armeniaca]|nr:hypothetical protein GBA52_008318 [Prunus armeniaca]
MNNATQSTVDIPYFLKKYKKVSTSGVSSNQDDTTAVVTEPATREPSDSDYTLAMMLESPRADSPWDGNYVAGKYRNIIRDVIGQLPELMKKGESCPDDLTLVDHICIDRKSYRAHIKDIPNSSNTENLTTYRSKLRSLVKSILERDDNTSVEGGNTRVELTHFYLKVDEMKVALDDLWHHPLLMSPNERYFFPIDAHTRLENEKWGVWKDKYGPSESIDIKTTIAKSKLDTVFKDFYEKAKYEDNALGVHKYSRKICLHFRGQNSLEKVVEEELTSLFPKRLTHLYNFLNDIGISMQFLIKRKVVSTSGVSRNQDDTTAVGTEPATREPSNSNYTLAEMLKSPDATSPWDGNYVAEKYRNIIRDVIGQLPELMKKGESCPDDLTLVDHICIDRKSYRAHIRDIPNSSNTENLTTYRSKLRSLVKSILEGDDNTSVEGENTRVELTHFYFMVDEPKVALDDLWHHPLLMSPNERYDFPIDAHRRLENEKWGVWEDKYRQSESIDIKAMIEKSKCVIDFKPFYEKAKYQDNALGVLDYSRDISDHFQQQNSLKKVVEEELTSLFPERLTYLYDFLYGSGISMQFLIKR